MLVFVVLDDRPQELEITSKVDELIVPYWTQIPGGNGGPCRDCDNYGPDADCYICEGTGTERKNPFGIYSEAAIGGNYENLFPSNVMSMSDWSELIAARDDSTELRFPYAIVTNDNGWQDEGGFRPIANWISYCLGVIENHGNSYVCVVCRVKFGAYLRIAVWLTTPQKRVRRGRARLDGIRRAGTSVPRLRSLTICHNEHKMNYMDFRAALPSREAWREGAKQPLYRRLLASIGIRAAFATAEAPTDPTTDQPVTQPQEASESEPEGTPNGSNTRPMRFHELGLKGFPVFVTDPVGAGLDAQFNSFDDKLLLQGVETRWAPGGDEPTIADLKLLSPQQLDQIIEAGGLADNLPLSLIEDIPDTED